MSQDHRPPHPQCHQAPPVPPPSPGTAERKLLERLISSLERPAAKIERAAVGRFFVGVMAEGRMGLASTLGHLASPQDRPVIEGLAGAELVRAAENLFSSSPLAISLGLASLNAGLVSPDLDRGPNAEEIIADLGRDREVVVVGHFPFTATAREVASRLHLLELRDVPGRTERGEWDRVLAGCDLAAITSTALLTRSMAYFLKQAKRAYKILVGPSTPLSAVLFEEGAEALAGSVVTAPEAVLAGIEADGTFRDLKKLGIRFVYLRPGD